MSRTISTIRFALGRWSRVIGAILVSMANAGPLLAAPSESGGLIELQSLTEPLPAPPSVVSEFPPLPCEPASPPASSSAPVELDKLMWKKGDFTILPYGIVWANAIYSTQRSFPGSFTLWVESPSRQTGDEFIIDARNTRLGFDITGPRIACWDDAQSSAKIEFDFQGNFSGTENRGGLLLRHAYVEVKNDEFRLLAGETWDIISPLNPGLLMYSPIWCGGNIGFRRAQFRGERYIACADESLWTLQGSINQNVFPDTITGVTGRSSAWPIIEGRTAITLGQRTGPEALPVTLGVSGHIGETEYNTAAPLPVSNHQSRLTWSGNIDLRVPLSNRCGFQGECFIGQDLSSYLGGINQGLDITTLDAIRSLGGWVEFWVDWTPEWHTHTGYGIDDPNNNDLHTAGERSYNQVYFANLSYDVTKQLLIGFEASVWKTQYIQLEPGNLFRCGVAVKYGF